MVSFIHAWKLGKNIFSHGCHGICLSKTKLFRELKFFVTDWSLLLFLYGDSSGYNAKKINENMECEIMQVVLEDARESYAKEIVVELQSDSIEQMEENVSRIKAWKDQWIINNKKDE